MIGLYRHLAPYIPAAKKLVEAPPLTGVPPKSRARYVHVDRAQKHFFLGSH